MNEGELMDDDDQMGDVEVLELAQEQQGMIRVKCCHYTADLSVRLGSQIFFIPQTALYRDLINTIKKHADFNNCDLLIDTGPAWRTLSENAPMDIFAVREAGFGRMRIDAKLSLKHAVMNG